MQQALGVIETKGLIGGIEAADAMGKAASRPPPYITASLPCSAAAIFLARLVASGASWLYCLFRQFRTIGTSATSSVLSATSPSFCNTFSSGIKLWAKASRGGES